MKIFISSDMEGTAGVVDWDQCMSTGLQYPYYADLLTAEINAAIEGAMQAGATEFLVNDAHSKMANLKPDALAGRASYLSGRYKPMYMMQGLDRSFDAIFLVSYHGSMGSEGSTLSHTYFPLAFAEVTINGIVAGEAGINALVASAYGVPIVLVTGDETTAEETRRFCPAIKAAVVKKSITRFAAESLHPSVAQDLIREQAGLALDELSTAGAPEIERPVTLAISFRTSDYCELASRVAGVDRTGPLAATIVSEDPLEIYQRFITVVLLCRGLVE
ncbi:M55 family metallopeptidase [Jatrophihabitans lederbergiae]|uniref:M55 family metallopeptidase n=1 Tax=Jatrophihabitans lederbergiae TaxID=3075547 RepID=A0ABU2JCF8_9ACTN|nr:M55 family metallopeptidase [Jatrophihabitans sp. DSM 44399]MDT0262627.1 M55 family metallopeptidase [Jatrophihabitans sp. DSM 44399]